jgi:hypothetical protein
MITFVVKEKEETPADIPLEFAGLGALALTPFTKILLGGAAAVFLVMGGTVAWQQFKLQRQEIQILQLENESQNLQNEIDLCKSQIDRQNQLIDQIKSDAEDDIALIEEVNDQLNRVIRIQDNEVDRLKDLPVPETCEESKQLLLDNLRIFEVSEK